MAIAIQNDSLSAHKAVAETSDWLMGWLSVQSDESVCALPEFPA